VNESPRVSALIVSYNTRALLLEAVGSVVDEPSVETIVFDNASRDGSPEELARRFPAVQVLSSPTNVGFAAGVNRAAACARGEALLVLNPDARLSRSSLHQLLNVLQTKPRAALVSPALRYTDGRTQAAAFRFPGLTQVVLDLFPVARLTDTPLNGRIRTHTPAIVDHPLGACMLIRRVAWQDVGPLDEGYFMYVEEIDWCRRARARGWQIWYHPAAVAVHHGGSATRQHADAMFAELWRSRLRYYARYHGPFYNRLVHLLVRLGLRRDSPAAQSVRHLAS
jgi:N-acetylglucosaminyl-diphospho-decaprenol L-rhamnosyltransferase